MRRPLPLILCSVICTYERLRPKIRWKKSRIASKTLPLPSGSGRRFTSRRRTVTLPAFPAKRPEVIRNGNRPRRLKRNGHARKCKCIVHQENILDIFINPFA